MRIDHDELRHDALLASVVGKEDPTGSTRVQPRDRGKALAGKSTLNRLELTPDDASGSSRYKKIVADESGLDALFVEQFVSAHERAPVSIVLDVDATCLGTVEELERIIAQIRRSGGALNLW